MSEHSPVNEFITDLVQTGEADRFSDPLEARKKAMDYLARREHSRDELYHKMERAGFEPNVAIDAIERLQKDGLQSDRRFVDAFVQARINQGKGPTRIRAELCRRGIRDAMIHEVLTETQQDWSALAREIRVKKFGSDTPAEFKEKARQMRFLQYRGFEPDQVRSAVSSHDE
ncbi:MAG: regulatory protein RecX [Woeseiaceae bacterium]